MELPIRMSLQENTSSVFGIRCLILAIYYRNFSEKWVFVWIYMLFLRNTGLLRGFTR